MESVMRPSSSLLLPLPLPPVIVSRRKQATRRAAVTAIACSVLAVAEAVSSSSSVGSCAMALPELNLDFNMVAPEQTMEEAMSRVREDADSLLGVKWLVESESWGEAQRALRKASAPLKKDMYTIIQNMPREDRPSLRKLYSNLFNAVTGLDYAARDADKPRVLEFYGRITQALAHFFSIISL